MYLLYSNEIKSDTRNINNCEKIEQNKVFLVHIENICYDHY